MKFSKSMLLFASVIALSGCDIFGQDNASSDIETSSQSESVSEETSSQSSETAMSDSSEASEDSDSSENESSSSAEELSEAEGSEESQTPDNNSVEDIIAAIHEDVASDYEAFIPTNIPLTEGVFPTAYTSETDMGIQIDFYATTENVAYGDERLANGEFDDAKVVSVTIDNYESNEAAAEQISQNNYAEIGGEEINMGYGITGYQDAGAGQISTGWNEGRWDFASQGPNDGKNQGLEIALGVVEYLENNLLPAPEDYGMGRFSVSNPESNQLAFQKGNKVITIDGNTNPYKLLEMATYIQ